MRASAAAHPNVALVKYWGKRDERLVLPHQSSLSLTLDGMEARASVRFDPALGEDQIAINGAPATAADRPRVEAVLDAVRALAGLAQRAWIETVSDFPVSAGLASSAAGYAALAGAAAWAAGLTPAPEQLSAMARLGSGSAARSVHAGFAIWDRGSRADGADSVARALLGPDEWPVRMVLAVVDERPKAISSREAMRRTAETSPYFAAWVQTAEEDAARAAAAVQARDLAALGEIAESNFWRMHAAALAARPPILFLQPATLAALAAIRELRATGASAWGTVDAGPNVAALCAAQDAPRVERTLAAVPGVRAARTHAAGGGVRCLERG